MLVFDVLVNGQPKCRAGVGQSGVLTAITSWLGPTDHRGKLRPEQVLLHVGGIIQPGQHVHWLDEYLKRGDTVTIHILDAAHAEEPATRLKPPRSYPKAPSGLRVAQRRKAASR